MSDPCRRLPGHLHDICSGVQPHPKREAFLRAWAADGRIAEADVPGLLAPCERSERPSLVDKARHLASDAAKLGGAIVTGQRVLATREEIAARKAACGECPKNEDGWCGLCGCNLAAKQKSVAWDCPIGRWPKIAESVSSGST